MSSPLYILYFESVSSTLVAARPLRSPQSFTLNVPRVRLKTNGDRAFEVAAGILSLRSCDSIECFFVVFLSICFVQLGL